MTNYKGDFKAAGQVLKNSWQRKHQGNSHTLRKFRKACKIHGSFLTGCENFAHPANSFHTLCEIFAEHEKNFAHLKPFRTLCKNQEALCENEKSLCQPFLNPQALTSPFHKHQTPYESLIFLCHLATSSLSIRHPTSCTSL